MLLLPGGPCVWTTKQIADGESSGCELFLHHGEHLRMSAGIVHGADGALQHLALICEDALGPWPSQNWPDDVEARVATQDELRDLLAKAGLVPETVGFGHKISANLMQSPIADAQWSDTRVFAAGANDTVILCASETVAIVAPNCRGIHNFSCAVVWLPTYQTMHMIEVSYDAAGTLESTKCLQFEVGGIDDPGPTQL